MALAAATACAAAGALPLSPAMLVAAAVRSLAPDMSLQSPIRVQVLSDIHAEFGSASHHAKTATRDPLILLRLAVPNRQRKKAYDTRMRLAVTVDPTEAAKLASTLRRLNEQWRQVEG